MYTVNFGYPRYFGLLCLRYGLRIDMSSGAKQNSNTDVGQDVEAAGH